jgi:putative ABC transport system permease protein
MIQPSALALLLRRERSDLAALGLVTFLIAFTAFVSAAGIRLFERAADDALRSKVAAAPAVQRTIRLTATRSLFGQDAVRTIEDRQAEGEQLRGRFPEAIRALVGDGNLAIGSVRLRVSNPPDYPLFITLRHQDEFQALGELVSGRWPASTDEQLPPVAEFLTTEGGVGYPVATEHASDEPRRFEIALQEASARSLGLSIGSRLSVGVDLIDPMLSTSDLRFADIVLAPTELEITGLYRVPDPDSDAWFGDPRLSLDDLGLGSDTPIADINAYVSPAGLPGFVTSGLPFEYRWRFPILVDRLDADAVRQTQRGLRILESQPAGTDESRDITIEAGLLPLLERHSGLRAGSEAVLTLAASAPLALAGGAIAMAAVLLTRRRRAAMTLARGRGASGRLLLAASLVESVVVVAGACLTGLGLAIALEPAAELEPSLIASVSIGLVAVVVLGAAAWPQIRQPLADLERGDRPPTRADPRRLVAELSLVALALVGAYVLRQRGIAAAAAPSSGSDVGASVSLDPFLAAVPPLIAFATGIIAVRLYRPAMAVAGWLAGRRRDLVPVLGVRTVARGAAPSLPVLVLLLAVAFAAFMSVVSTSVDQAQRTASWVAVGADVRLEPAGSRSELPSAADTAAISGVAATAVGFIAPRVRASSGTQMGTVMLQSVDAAAYADVVTGSPIVPHWPQVFLDRPLDGPVPAIVASTLTGGTLRLGQGDTFQITGLGGGVQMQVVEVRSGIAGLATGDAFVIVPHSWLEHALGGDVPPSVMWIRVQPDAVAALSERTGADAGAIRLTSRYDVYAALRDEPLVGAVGAGFASALGVSLAYAVLTILGAVLLSAGRRTRDVAILRTLGLNGRQATRLTMVEHAPPILVALPLGLALGIGVAFAVAPALSLGALSGSSGAIPLAIDWVALAALSAALSAVALAAVVVGTWLSRRATIINALRITNE